MRGLGGQIHTQRGPKKWNQSMHYTWFGECGVFCRLRFEQRGKRSERRPSQRDLRAGRQRLGRQLYYPNAYPALLLHGLCSGAQLCGGQPNSSSDGRVGFDLPSLTNRFADTAATAILSFSMTIGTVSRMQAYYTKNCFIWTAATDTFRTSKRTECASRRQSRSTGAGSVGHSQLPLQDCRHDAERSVVLCRCSLVV